MSSQSSIFSGFCQPCLILILFYISSIDIVNITIINANRVIILINLNKCRYYHHYRHCQIVNIVTILSTMLACNMFSIWDLKMFSGPIFLRLHSDLVDKWWKWWSWPQIFCSPFRLKSKLHIIAHLLCQFFIFLISSKISD